MMGKMEAQHKSEKNPKGLLTQSLDTYMSCFRFEKEQFIRAIDIDSKFWQDNLDNIEASKANLAQQMTELTLRF